MSAVMCEKDLLAYVSFLSYFAISLIVTMRYLNNIFMIHRAFPLSNITDLKTDFRHKNIWSYRKKFFASLTFVNYYDFLMFKKISHLS